MMKLFPDWQGKITLPLSPLRREVVGGNAVCQQAFRGGDTIAEAEALDNEGYYLVKTRLLFPFNELLLRRKGTRHIETNYLVLLAPDLKRIYELGPDTRLEWDDLGLLTRSFRNPEQILESWKGKFSFREEDNVTGAKGLRPPQIGALHAIAAHFAVGKNFEPATVVLPTGTGKTETMLSMQVYKRLLRTLVIVPSDALRTQIYKKFLTLGVLPDLEVVPSETIGPNVTRLVTGIRSKEEALAIIEKSNIIITLPKTLSASDPEALRILTEYCTDLIVDEAHHIPASQWSLVCQMFSDKRITQFTATPFRRDNKRIDGKIIFNYKLGDAQAADYYRPINLKTIEEFGDKEQRDLCIAEEALTALRRDRNELHLDHILMARCESKERAVNVFELYQKLAPEMLPQLVYSGPGRIHKNREALEKLIQRKKNAAQIVVCVDMLGEGFDLPNLKVAALHDTHKSLAITLQFIGRFTRKGNWEQIGEATVVVNIADSETETKLEALYAEGADWDSLIKRLSEDRIDQEIRLQKIVHNLRESGDLHTFLSLWNLRPSLSMQVFKTQCQNWSPENYFNVFSKDSKSWHAISKDNDILIAVVHRKARVRWGNYQNLFDRQYHLLMARWDKENGALFIHASDYEELKSTTLAKEITNDKTVLLQGPVIFNILNNVELPLVKNLGSSRIGAISFTSYFGPNVTEGLALIERAESTLNNIACVGYENGERVLWGGTQRRGKIWQQSSGTISQWIDWTAHTWEKVSTQDNIDVANITNEFLRPHKLSQPYNQYPISVQWGEQVQASFSNNQSIVFDTTEVPLYLVDLQISEVRDNGEIIIRLSSDTNSSEYSFQINDDSESGYYYKKISGPDVYFAKGTNIKTEVCEYFVVDPVIVRYVDGTYSYNCYHIPIPLKAGEYPRERIEVWDWASIPLNKESIGKTGNKNTIQYQSFLTISDKYDVVFNDDGKGEAGDLVCLKDIDESTIKLCLVHCKGALGGQISNDIGNFYTLCGQAQKSITVKHMGMTRLYNDLKRRHEIWARAGYSRFLKGDMKYLSYFKEKSRRSKLQFEVIIVQPGGSKAALSTDILKLLGTTELFLKTTTQGNLRVVVSP
ncbi:DEAD/DEAH box helicase [Ruminiclostridium cellulolyticum]|uniref:Type III restriction protein res subunit n=1 Tax=Ruminiclostridium cellulolyticum (strain ATCC 35319 / DSM 5812 / JCM 6584 / H10) TaxID=394503 RepID=B8I4A0_RUMCH|nr:DEAD/DEAH box helicase family protein [Ruminiclostridium cellulolyticum]ACL74454.1 type III restriction protein res subunit [Ruminiclostridium cellulolyticum H10]